PLELAKSCGITELDPRQYLPDLLCRADEAISHRLDPKVRQYYKQLLDLYLNTWELHNYTPALLHGDLSPEHFLADIEHCTLSGVIDFGDCFIGDPHRDFIFLLEDYGKDILELFLTFYAPGQVPQASRRVQLFQQLNNLEYCLTALRQDDPEELEEA